MQKSNKKRELSLETISALLDQKLEEQNKELRGVIAQGLEEQNKELRGVIAQGLEEQNKELRSVIGEGLETQNKELRGLVNQQNKELRGLVNQQNKELREVMREEIGFSEVRTDIKLMKLEQRIDDNAKQYRDDILTRMNETMGELETIREEQLIMGKDIDELKKETHN